MANYKTAQELFDALCMPFAAEEIDWRIGNTKADKSEAMALAYMDARAAMDRLDGVCGPDGWQCNYTPLPGHPSIICNLGVRVPSGYWIWKADGAGTSDIEAEKGMMSDAFKRASVRWGIGRYLYDLDAPWVKIEPAGKSYRIAKTELKRLNDVHDQFCEHAGWGKIRAGRVAYAFANQVVKHFVTTAADAIDLKERNAGMIAQMPVAMRNHLSDTLDRIGASSTQEA